MRLLSHLPSLHLSRPQTAQALLDRLAFNVSKSGSKSFAQRFSRNALSNHGSLGLGISHHGNETEEEPSKGVDMGVQFDLIRTDSTGPPQWQPSLDYAPWNPSQNQVIKMEDEVSPGSFDYDDTPRTENSMFSEYLEDLEIDGLESSPIANRDPRTPPPPDSRTALQAEAPKSIYSAIFGKAFEKSGLLQGKSSTSSTSSVNRATTSITPKTPTSSLLAPTPTMTSGGRKSLPPSPSSSQLSTHASITQARSPFPSLSASTSSTHTMNTGNLIGTSTSAKLSLKASSPQLGSPSRRAMGGPSEDWDPHNEPTKEQRQKEHKDAFAKPLLPIYHQSPGRSSQGRRGSELGSYSKAGSQSPSPSKRRKMGGEVDLSSPSLVHRTSKFDASCEASTRSDHSRPPSSPTSRRARIFSAGVGLRPSPSSSPSRQRFSTSQGSPPVLPNGHPASSLAQGLGLGRFAGTPGRSHQSSFRDHLSRGRRASEDYYEGMDIDSMRDGDQDQFERDRVASVLAGLQGSNSNHGSPLRGPSDLRSSPSQHRESHSRGPRDDIGSYWSPDYSRRGQGDKQERSANVPLRKTLCGPVVLNGEREREQERSSTRSQTRPTTPSNDSDVPDDGEAAETMLLFAGSPSQPTKEKSRGTFDGIPHTNLRPGSNELQVSSQESSSSSSAISYLNLKSQSDPSSQDSSSQTPPASNVSLPQTSDDYTSRIQPQTPLSNHAELPKTPGSEFTMGDFVRTSPSPQPRSISSFGGTTPQLGGLSSKLTTPTSSGKGGRSGNGGARVLDFGELTPGRLEEQEGSRHYSSPSLNGTPRKRVRAVSKEEAKVLGR